MSEVLGMKSWQAAAAAANMRGSAAQEATAANRTAAIPRGPDWGETLQSASRLRVVMGETRRVVAVTGIEESDTAGPLAAQLALALAELEQSRPVLFVDGHAASPKTDTPFGVSREPGLLDILEGRIGLEQAVHRVGHENLYLLPLGSSPNQLASLLTSETTGTLLRAARERFRYVLIDAGLIRKSASAILLAGMSDGVLVALARGIRRRDEVAAFQRELESLKIPTLGAVLTRTAKR